ncbi:tetratricopeptide repeat protein [Fontivita pretiosa]|uniref:serine/threonine-protein kinase n=1 Tax=Fontivita pretiosa TaxID=2989684 RepID=UPI003D16D034
MRVPSEDPRFEPPFALMAILDQLEQLDGSQRQARLAELATQLTPEQFRQLQASLLSRDESAGAFLESPPSLVRNAQDALHLAGAASPPLPQHIGHYRVLRILGEGGMGLVYEAEQTRPHRRVALKVIRLGTMTPTMMRRFEFEADVLARLEHPGIARIYEAGVAEAPGAGHGPQPFFAMELVQGQRLDRYLAAINPTVDRRLRLLIQICQAVHHAHTRGIIHRDLKPANILISPDGSPKILDFGVARMTDSDLRATLADQTQSGQLLGTLPYMAPEQAAGRVRELDTACDVYALGVIGYEMLGGRMPYRIEGRPLHEAVRVICEEEPSRLSSINRNLRGDIETIIGKALEKDRTRRYATAGELAEDLRRFLDDEPITARAPGTWYQLRKFARRNRVLVTSVAATMLTLAAASIALTVGYFRQRELSAQLAAQKAAAETARDDAVAMTSFFTEDLLARAAPSSLPAARVRDAVIAAMIQPAEQLVSQRFRDRPLLEAAVRNKLGELYYFIGRVDAGVLQMQRAVQLYRDSLGPDDPNTLTTMSNLAGLYQAQGKLTEAEELFAQAWQRASTVLGPDSRYSFNIAVNYGTLLWARGKSQQAVPILRDTLARMRGALGEDHPDTLSCANALAVALQADGQLQEAEPIYRDVLDRRRRTLADTDPAIAISMNNLAYLLDAQRKYADARPLYDQVYARLGKVLGEDHPDTIRAANNLGDLLRRTGRLTDARPLLQNALDRRRRILGALHPETLASLNNLAMCLMDEKDLAGAEPLLGELFQAAQSAQITPTQAARYMSWHGVVLCRLGRNAQAEPALRTARQRLAATEQQHTHWYANVVDALARICQADGRLDEAARYRAELSPATGP